MFKLVSNFSPAGDQIAAIEQLTNGIKSNIKNQTLLGVTGSGKTFTMANVIKNLNQPALVMAPNKILSAQLYEEFKAFFPENAVEYFVSYYDYYRPEAYVPQSGLYIEKEASINEIIDQLRHKATRALMERNDVIIVASVSCIYGIGSVEAYRDMAFKISLNDRIGIAELARNCVKLSYEISPDLGRGKIRTRSDYFWIGPSHVADRVWRITVESNRVVEIVELDPLTREVFFEFSEVTIFPNTHHITPEVSLSKAVIEIENELDSYLPSLIARGKLAEAQRLEERTRYDLHQLKTTHFCQGIENYSRYFTNRVSGSHPPTLFEYFPRPFLLFVDESHISLPQLHGMSRGDAARKQVLIEHGFRLPSAKDNRPMTFEEWDAIRPNTIFVSATPGIYELQNSSVVQQIVRPTGLLDPICIVRPTTNQVEDALAEAREVIKNNNRVLMITLTKRTAESLTEYISNCGMKVAYLHGEQTTIERIQKLYDFRKGKIDIIVGINLLREGIDVPECALVCVFEADQEGFLRTSSALIQMIGRAARHDLGRVILYADRNSQAINDALSETSRRRSIQEEYNRVHNITPTKITKEVSEAFAQFLDVIKDEKVVKQEWLTLKAKQKAKLIKNLEKAMKKAAAKMDFEEAAKLRDQRNALLTLDIVT